MIETYQCPDGRAVLLSFNEDDLSVEVSNLEGETIGSYQFLLVGPDGEAIDLMNDTGSSIVQAVGDPSERRVAPPGHHGTRHKLGSGRDQRVAACSFALIHRGRRL